MTSLATRPPGRDEHQVTAHFREVLEAVSYHRWTLRPSSIWRAFDLNGLSLAGGSLLGG